MRTDSPLSCLFSLSPHVCPRVRCHCCHIYIIYIIIIMSVLTVSPMSVVRTPPALTGARLAQLEASRRRTLEWVAAANGGRPAETLLPAAQLGGPALLAPPQRQEQPPPPPQQASPDRGLPPKLPQQSRPEQGPQQLLPPKTVGGLEAGAPEAAVTVRHTAWTIIASPCQLQHGLCCSMARGRQQ